MADVAKMSLNIPSNQSAPLATIDERSDSFLFDVYLRPLKIKEIKIVYFQPNKVKFSISPQSIISRGYQCEVSTTIDNTLGLLQDPVNQVILVINIENTLNPAVQSLLSKFQSLNYHDSVTVLGLLSHFSKSKPNDSVLSMLLEFRVSRLISSDEGERRFFHELKMIEATELRYKRMLQFSQALKDVVHNSQDAVQVSNKDASIMYANKSFQALNRVTADECLGRPAVEVLGWLQDNGLKSVFLNKERWEGDYTIDKRMASSQHQRLSLLPVKNPRGATVNYVSIQRILPPSSDTLESPKPRIPPVNCTSPDVQPVPMLRSSGSLGSLGSQPRISSISDVPIASSVYIAIAGIVKDQNCPSEIKESLEKCLETMRNDVPHSNHTTRHDIVGGLLGNERQYSADGTRLPVTHHHSHAHPTSSRPPHMIQKCLDNVSTWDFSIVELERISNNSPLYYVGMEIFNEFQVQNVLGVDDSVVKSWLKLMEASYHRSNTYHNSTHAADVLQGAAYLVRKLQFSLKENDEEPLDPLELASIFITAIIHDVDHPGRTNSFLSNSQHELALLYNDRAVLENHHAAYSFKITLDRPEHNIYKALDLATFRTLRASLVDLVLATDMSKHFDLLTKFNRYLLSSQVEDLPTTSANQESRMLTKRILVKCADISNATRPSKLCREWASRVSEEYFCQTEEEKQKGLPVTFRDFERETCKLPVTQVKFMDFFVIGLFEAWNSLCPIPILLEQATSNYTYWKNLCDPADLEPTQSNPTSPKVNSTNTQQTNGTDDIQKNP